MKKRIKGIIAIFLVLLMLVGMAQPIKASAYYGSYLITYMNPGELISLSDMWGGGYGARLCICKPGTNPADISSDDVIKTYHLYHESDSDDKFLTEMKLPEFKDVGISGDYKQWLFVQMPFRKPDTTFVGEQYCVIPVKGSEEGLGYVEDAVYSDDNHSVTFTVSEEGTQKLDTVKNSSNTTKYLWSTYKRKDAESQIYFSSDGTANEHVSVVTDTAKDEYTVTFDDDFEFTTLAPYTEALNINEKALAGTEDDSVSFVNYIAEYDVDLKYNGSEPAADDMWLNCELLVKDSSGNVDDAFYDDARTTIKGKFYRTFQQGMLEQDGKLEVSIGSNKLIKVSGTIKIKLYPTKITIRPLQEGSDVIIDGNSITVKCDYDPDTQFVCQMSNDNWKVNEYYCYTLVSNYAKILKAFNISSKSSSYGTITVDKKAIVGDEVSVTLAPKNGYTATGITVKTDSGKTVSTTKKSNNTYTFKMPAENVNIDANFKALSNSVKITAVNNVTVKADKTKALAGEKVTVTATPKDGYKVTAISVKDASGKAITVKKNSSGKYYFTMPSSAVTVKATVKADPYIKLGASKLSMSKGQTFSLSKVTTTVAPYDKVASYKSSKASVVAVDSKGKLTAKATGSAAITITTKKGAKGKITVNVGSKAITTTKVKVTNVENGKLTLKKGKTFKTETAVTPITSQDKLSFASNKATVASVDSKGKITAKKAGKATITVTSGKQKATFVVTVK